MDFNKYIEQQVQEIDIAAMVRREIREQIGSQFQREYKSAIRNGIDQIIRDEIEVCMREPINTNDGWGNRATYSSFEDLFKKEFREKLGKTYEVNRTIEKQVKEYVATLFNNEYKQVVDSIVNGLVADKKK